MVLIICPSRMNNPVCLFWIIIIIIINIKDRTLWSVLSRELQLLVPTLLRALQLLSFLAVCSGMISKGFGFVAFFAIIIIVQDTVVLIINIIISAWSRKKINCSMAGDALSCSVLSVIPGSSEVIINEFSLVWHLFCSSWKGLAARQFYRRYQGLLYISSHSTLKTCWKQSVCSGGKDVPSFNQIKKKTEFTVKCFFLP